VVSTFILVHGAWHGGWCWQGLVPQLEARGHRSVVMDLPVEDGDATFEDYAEAVLASYPANLEDGVLVGHSLGAMVLPLVAASRPPSLTGQASFRPSNPHERLLCRLRRSRCEMGVPAAARAKLQQPLGSSIPAAATSGDSSRSHRCSSRRGHHY
jgi:pimeloyl-ACP methyl ester carboxylesterase